MKKQKIHNLSLWKKYKKASTTKRKSLLEKKLVEIYYPLVQKISYKVSEKIGWRLSPEELTSMGVDGLYVAIRRFSLDRGVNFPTYSNRRIRGSMIDGIRKNDIIPRSVRINWNIINKARNNLEIQKGRKVTEYEVIRKLEIDDNEYYKNFKKYNPLSFSSIDHINNEQLENEFSQDFNSALIDISIVSSDSKVLRKEFFSKLLSQNFSRLEQKIIYLYYYKNYTMELIAVRFNMSESRISQIHKNILQRLKDKISRNPEYFDSNIQRCIQVCNDNNPIF